MLTSIPGFPNNLNAPVPAALLDYFKLIPPGWDVVIAGGAAADFSLASDVDLWILPTGMEKAVRRDSLYKKAEEGHNANMVLYELRDYLYHGVGQTLDIQNAPLDSEKYMEDNQVMRLLDVYGFGALKAQIMFTTYPNVLALLNSFDISTHMVAVNRAGTRILNLHATPTDIQPVLYHANAIGGGTPARLVRIAKRYGFTIDPADAVEEALLVRDGDYEPSYEGYRSPYPS